MVCPLKKWTAILAIAILLFPYQATAQITPTEEPVVAPIVVVADEPLVANAAVAEQLYQDWLTEQKKPKAVKKVTAKAAVCSCVLYAKALTGYTKSIGVARRWTKNSPVPVVGGVVITNESPAGHVAFVAALDGDIMTLDEANYTRCKVTAGRKLNVNNPIVLGFWTP